MKTFIKSLLKPVALLCDPAYVRIYRWLKGHPGPIPPLANRLRVGSTLGIGRFLEAGRKCFLPINRAIEDHAEKPLGELRVLDFGAGVGRTLQFFYGKPRELFATDVDPTAIAWLGGSYPELKAARNEFVPPLDFPDDYFDVVYSVSVWTHLPVKLQEPWLDEIRRILKPGGLALLTTLGVPGITRLRSPDPAEATPEKLLAAGLLYFEYGDLQSRGDRYLGITDSYGLTYHSKDYVARVWGGKFRVLGVEEGVIDDLQDLVILRKE